MKDKLKITVMRGGPSAEREVSLQSGAAVASALRSLGHEVEELDPQDDRWELTTGTDVVFLALHGRYGEDGTVQARLDSIGIPYTGSGAEASRAAFDKVRTKERCAKLGIATPRFKVLTGVGGSWPLGWKPPLVLKPVCQGSSVGLRFVDRVADWEEAVREAFRHGGPVLVEARIIGREVTVGILGDQVLPLVEVRPKQGAYDYKNKYTAGATDYFCPAPFDEAVTERVREAGRRAFEAMGCRDYGRVDVMVDLEGNPFMLEVNTLPGMTETSLLPKAAAAAGISYSQLCEKMIQLAFNHGADRKRMGNAA